MSLIRWIIGFLIAVIVTAFAVSNRHMALLYFSPLHPPLEFPLYVIGLGLIAFGFLLGAFTVWLNSASIRRSKRKQSKHIKTLEKALDAVNENGKAHSPPSDFFPALPKNAKK